MRTMATMTVSQLSCFPAMNRQPHLSRRSLLCPTTHRPKSLSLVVMSLEGGSQTKTSLNYTSDASRAKPDPVIEEEQVAQPKKAAKIHDFCFGIPFGAIVLSGGLIGFILSRNPATLSTVLFGGALLALSTFSLKIWRQGKSGLPFILGQAALAAVLLWKNFQTYTLTKKVFPTGFYAAISAAMLFFYSYVVLSGGNPPPKKKLKSSAGAAS